jgi:hypothetical protein
MTTRILQAAVSSAISQPVVRWRFLFACNTVYAITGETPVVFAGNTYAPVLNAVEVEPIVEEADAFPRELVLRFPAVSSSQLYDPVNENWFNQTLIVRRAVIADDATLVASAEQIWKGRIETVTAKLGDPGRGDHFEVRAMSLLMRRARAAYRTREDLWLTYSGDTFFNYLDQIRNFKSHWGGKEQSLFAVSRPAFPGYPGGVPWPSGMP